MCGQWYFTGMKWRRVLAEALVLIAVAGIVGASANSFRGETRTLAWRLRVEPPPKDPSLIYLEITSEVALRLHRAGVLFLDARRSDAYALGHIEHAINIPVWEHDADNRVSTLRSRGLKQDTPIVVYCTGGTCEDAIMLAGKVALAGFYNIYVYKNGFPDWQRRNWPITKGIKP